MPDFVIVFLAVNRSAVICYAEGNVHYHSGWGVLVSLACDPSPTGLGYSSSISLPCVESGARSQIQG